VQEKTEKKETLVEELDLGGEDGDEVSK